MFIEVEQTPNPESLKFLPNRPVSPKRMLDFASEASASRSPLAKALFSIGGVKGVFLGEDFITVTKTADQDWIPLKPSVLGLIMEHFTAGLPVVEEDTVSRQGSSSISTTKDFGDAQDIVNQILELLETRVRPAVAQDGGDIVFEDFTDGILYLQLRGACAGCPSSTATLKSGIENMMKHYIPEVLEVRAAQ